VSREILQINRDVDIININIIKKVLDTLTDINKDEYEKFLQFYKEFGRILKEGIHYDFSRRETIADLLLFEGFDHAMFMRHLADPVIRFESHSCSRLSLFHNKYNLCKFAPFYFNPAFVNFTICFDCNAVITGRQIAVPDRLFPQMGRQDLPGDLEESLALGIGERSEGVLGCRFGGRGRRCGGNLDRGLVDRGRRSCGGVGRRGRRQRGDGRRPDHNDERTRLSHGRALYLVWRRRTSGPDGPAGAAGAGAEVGTEIRPEDAVL
jgi:hypothetical protein